MTAVTIDPRRHDAVIFDLDGVVTDTAAVHAATWRSTFDGFLARRGTRDGEDHGPFTNDDYELFVDGKPRSDGVEDFLASRGIALPWGSPSDHGDDDTVCAVGNIKDRAFHAHLAGARVPAFESTVALIKKLQGNGVGTAVFSSSRNCAEVLTSAGLEKLFTVRVDGVVAHDLGLAGKPDPAVLVEAARRLGAEPSRTVVVEDSEAGVEAGRRGGFALVIGVDRTNHARELRGDGADVVVTDLAEVSVHVGDRRMSAIPNLIDEWDLLAAMLTRQRPAVFLDFDGTVSTIVKDPAAAALVDGAAAALTRLATHCAVGVISGRSLAEVQARVGLTNVWYAGSHGFELVGPAGQRHRNDDAAAAIPDLERAGIALEAQLGDIAGIFIEHKPFGVAVHYRNVAAEQVRTIEAAVRDAAGPDGMLRVTGGRMVSELRPAVDWDKGRALCWALDHIDEPNTLLPIYIGDDLTDEDAFDALPAGGVSIVVRNNEGNDRRSAAQFAVDSPEQVCEVLSRLADVLEGEPASSDPWTLSFDGYDPSSEKLREALCTVGNGVFATRGCAPESDSSAEHYPGTYAAGVYNRLNDEIDGKTIDNESLVNLPNWLPVTFRVDEGEWFDIDAADLLDYRQELDLRRAVLHRRFRFRDNQGRTTDVVQRRFVAMHRPHAAALETTISALDWSGRIEFRSLLDGAVRNTLVGRYRDLSSNHLEVVETKALSTDSALLISQTVQSRIPIALSVRNTLWRNDKATSAAYELVDEDGKIGHDIKVDVAVGESVTLEKMVTVFTGRDHAISTPADEGERWLARLGRFDEELDAHSLVWAQLWEHFQIELDGRGSELRIVRLHLLHLLQTVSPNTVGLDVGVPARGLHGEAYRGHIFWDELFVFPVLNLRLPTLTRSLLRYRYLRLPEARQAATAVGHKGAMFPWQSGSDGREESQQLHLNPRSGRWNPDPSRHQHHIGIAVAYNVWQYYQVTGDLEFLKEYGTEMLVEVARFFASLATYDLERDRFDIRGVIGPDEFHSGYPGKPYSGVDNNAYTNVMSVWVILRALDALALVPTQTRADLLSALAIDDEEIAHWETVSRRLFVPMHDGVISQFESYGDLDELDWDAYRSKYGDIQRLDRILEAEGDDVNRYRASKQADVLMLFYLLSADELRELLERLGYDFAGEAIPRTIDYYIARTSHGSTLSSVVHSWVLARANRDQAMEYFDRVLASDIADVQGGTTSEGIHLAAMSGSVDLLQRCFSGLEIRADRLVLCPQWPEALGLLEFGILYRGHRLRIQITGRKVEVTADAGIQPPIEIECRGQLAELRQGETVCL